MKGDAGIGGDVDFVIDPARLGVRARQQVGLHFDSIPNQIVVDLNFVGRKNGIDDDHIAVRGPDRNRAVGIVDGNSGLGSDVEAVFLVRFGQQLAKQSCFRRSPRRLLRVEFYAHSLRLPDSPCHLPKPVSRPAQNSPNIIAENGPTPIQKALPFPDTPPSANGELPRRSDWQPRQPWHPECTHSPGGGCRCTARWSAGDCSATSCIRSSSFNPAVSGSGSDGRSN